MLAAWCASCGARSERSGSANASTTSAGQDSGQGWHDVAVLQ